MNYYIEMKKDNEDVRKWGQWCCWVVPVNSKKFPIGWPYKNKAQARNTIKKFADYYKIEWRE